MNAKERRKQIIVGVLACVAVVLVVWNAVGSKPKRGGARTAVVLTPAPTTPGLPGAGSPVAQTPSNPTPDNSSSLRLPPDGEIELAMLVSRFPQWTEAPARDPFFPVTVSTNAPKNQGPPPPKASERLAIRAIWRQSGTRLAVVNEAVLGEGDRIAGYLVEKIDASQIWVRGTNGFESVDFLVGSPKAVRSDRVLPKGAVASGNTTQLERTMPR